jgi:hypothetical protein
MSTPMRPPQADALFADKERLVREFLYDPLEVF